MPTPTIAFYARIPQNINDRLNNWSKVHGLTKAKMLIFFAAKAGVISQQELLEVWGAPPPIKSAG